MKSKTNLFFLLFVIASLAAFAADPQTSEAKKVKCPAKVAVQVETVKAGTFAEYRTISGTAAFEVVAVVSPVAGVVSEIKINEGSLVDAGQELAVMNAGQDEKVKALESEVAKRKKVLTARQNWKEKSERAIQTAERDYQAALALLEEAKALGGRMVQAPVAGIARLKTAAGAEVAAADLLFEIVDPLRLRVEAPLAAEAAGLFAPGETLTAMAEGVAGEWSAEIAAAAEGRIAFRVDNAKRQLQEGMTISCRKLLAEHADVATVPAHAILFDSLGDFVYVAEKGRAKKFYVTRGASEGGRVLISQGLVAGAPLIVSGFDCLGDMKKVRVVNETPLSAPKTQMATQAPPVAGTETASKKDEEKKAKAAAAAELKVKREQEKQALAAAAAELKAKREQEKQAQAAAAAELKAKKEQEKLAKTADAKAKQDQERQAKADAAAEAKAKKEREQQAKAVAKAAACPKKVAVQTELTQRSTFQEYGYYTAVASPETVPVSAAEAGWILALRAEEGAQVEKGNELLILVAGDNEKIAKLRQEEERKAKVLADRQAAKVKNERAIQAAERDLQKTRSLLENEAAPYARALAAPVAGVVRNMKAVAGASVAAGDLLLEIVSESQMLVTLQPGAAAAGRFVLEERLVVKAEGQETEIPAQVIAIEGNKVTLRLANDDRRLAAGTQIAVRKLIAEHAEVVAVSAAALAKDSLGDFVYIVEKKRAKKVYVVPGASEAGRTMIDKGLGADAQLVVSDLACLADKKSVHVVNEAEMAKLKETAAKQQALREEKTAVAPVAKGSLADFLSYLDGHREELGYERYEKSMWKGLEAVKIFSGRETQKKLLDVIPGFAISEVTFELQDAWIVSTIAFKKAEAIIAEKEKEAEKEAEKVKAGRSLFGNRLKIGIHGAYYLMMGKNFKEAYGGMMGFGGELSFRFTRKLDFWVSGGMAGKKAGIEWSDDGMEFSMIPLSAAVRYYLGEKGRLSPFVGAGANYFMVEDSSPTGDIKENLIGFHALAGAYYKLGTKLHVQLLAKYNMVKKDLFPESSLDDPLDLGGLQLLFGISYSI